MVVGLQDTFHPRGSVLHTNPEVLVGRARYWYALSKLFDLCQLSRCREESQASTDAYSSGRTILLVWTS